MRDIYEVGISFRDDKTGASGLNPPRPVHAYFTLRSKVDAAIAYPDAFGNPDVEELHEAWVYTSGVLGRVAAEVAANMHTTALKHGCQVREDCGTCGVTKSLHLIAPGHALNPPVASLIEVAVPFEQRGDFHAWFETQVRRIGDADG